MSVKLLEGAGQTSPSDPYTISGQELVNVRLVGRIVAIEDDASTCKVMIHDGTGTAQFTIYTDNGLWPATRATYTCVARGGGVFVLPPPRTCTTCERACSCTVHLLHPHPAHTAASGGT